MTRLPKTYMVACFIFLVCLAGDTPAQSTAPEDPQAFLGKYCVDCHTADDPSGEREFETLDLGDYQWETQHRLQEVVDQLSLGAMPPEDADQPSTKDRLSAITQLTKLLSKMREQTASTGGQTVLRRLSRREYRNTVSDMLAIDTTMFDPTIEFPADNLSNHFDNIGATLVTSGYLLEKNVLTPPIDVSKRHCHPSRRRSHKSGFSKASFRSKKS
jgi:hypothetical protein